MNILFIVEHFYPHIGGAEKLLLDLATSLIKQGQNVIVLTSNSGGITGKHSINGVEIHSFDWKSFFGHPIPNKSDIYEYIEWADIVQTAIYTAAPVALSCAKKTNKPCVLLSHEYLGDRWKIVESPVKAKLFKIFEWWVFHKPYNQYIAISRATKADIVKGGIKSSRIKVIYPVFNDFSFWNNDKAIKATTKTKTFLYYGRPGKTKGVFLLLEAIRTLNKSLAANVVFTFILSNDPLKEREKLISLVKKYNLGERINILEPQNQPKLKNLILESYCVIVPSLTEGFGYSAYQACLLGKNIITSDAGSLPEVAFGKALVFKNGSQKSLAEAILKAENNEFKKVIKHIGGDQTQEVINLYRDLIS